MNIKHILEGIKNSIFVNEEVEKIAQARHAICNACPRSSANKNNPMFAPGQYYSEKRPDEHCSVCACNIHAKNRSLHTACPEERWSAVATTQEAAKIAAAKESIGK